MILAIMVSPIGSARDSGASHNLLLKAGLDDDWFLISRSNLASSNHFEKELLRFTGLALGYQLNPNWSVRAGYRHVWFNPVSTWLEEDRPFLEAYYSGHQGSFRLASRSRGEWRMYDYRKDYLRLRQEFTLEPTTNLGNSSVRPYLEEELFYNTDNQELEANWLGAGLAWRPQKGIKLKLGYRWNHFRVGGIWRDRDVLVTGINVFF